MSGRELRRLRLRAGLTLEQAARLFKMQPNSVWRKEVGRHRITYLEGVGIRTILDKYSRR